MSCTTVPPGSSGMYGSCCGPSVRLIYSSESLRPSTCSQSRAYAHGVRSIPDTRVTAFPKPSGKRRTAVMSGTAPGLLHRSFRGRLSHGKGSASPRNTLSRRPRLNYSTPILSSLLSVSSSHIAPRRAERSVVVCTLLLHFPSHTKRVERSI